MSVSDVVVVVGTASLLGVCVFMWRQAPAFSIGLAIAALSIAAGKWASTRYEHAPLLGAVTAIVIFMAAYFAMD